jgi:hypothetical protein
MPKIEKTKYIIWLYYGYDGWQPHPINNLLEITDIIANFSSQNWVLTSGIEDIKVDIKKSNKNA